MTYPRYTITLWEGDEYIVIGPEGPVGGTGHKAEMQRAAHIWNAAHAAVRRATLHEVRGVVEGMETHVAPDDRSLFVWHDDILSRLEALHQAPEAG
jgi:hypothetical protein